MTSVSQDQRSERPVVKDAVLLQAIAALRASRLPPGPDVLLLQAPQFLFESINIDSIRQRGYYAYPPTGLQWLATRLENRGLRVTIADINLLLLERLIQDPGYDHRNWLDLVRDEVARTEPAVAGVTCLSINSDLSSATHPLPAMLRAIRAARSCLLLAGGPTAMNDVSALLDGNTCDFVIDGEGEDRLDYLLGLWYGPEWYPAVAPPRNGIYFRAPDTGATVPSAGESAPVVLAGNLVKSFARIPVERYCRAGSLNPYSRMAGPDLPYAGFQLARGCRCNCQFCGVRTFMGAGTRVFPVADVLEEMDYLVRQRGVRHFEVLDDDFLARPEATAELLTGMVPLRRDFAITWSANNGLIAHSLTRELLALMRDSGCLGFKIGIESGNPDILRRMRKPGTRETFEQAAARLRDFPELFVGGNYIIGCFHEETFAQILDTFRFSCALGLDWSSFTVFQDNSRDLKAGGVKGKAFDFIPTKSSADRKLHDDPTLPLGLDLPSLDPHSVPGPELLKNIWLTFNLAGNYLLNPNLFRPGGAAKFTAWVEAIRPPYPTNPYMRLFAGYGRRFMGDTATAETHEAECRRLLANSSSWRHLFGRFGLDALVTPESGLWNATAASDQVVSLARRYAAALGVPVPRDRATRT
ncbi:MAG: hypothetical protein A3K19_09935 [Lentisphaerae bacterium RIFOXYB12_FULL_65_16]|nr:MAG: hypothetical protein A3K18_00670 [Lentisphaerae bacterium RIFOXYA12_64_32]OGV91273.1 MAG: hypothetical protein A3K19_09935 [Lentisphaerae bacterium RIFOXYB12_FULL_65_16]